MNRRRMLSLSASTVGISISGCTGSDDGGENGGGNAGPSQSEASVQAGESIQVAIDKVTAGGVVRIEEGVYEEQITLPRPMEIKSKGGAVITPGNEEEAESAGIAINTTSARLNNISVDGFKYGIGTQEEIEPDEVVLSNLKVSRSYENGINIEAEKIVLKNIIVRDIDGNGVNAVLPSDGELTVSSCRFDKCGLEDYETWPAVYIEGGSNIGVDNCTFSNCGGDGVYVAPGTAKGQTVSFTNSVVSDGGDSSINIRGSFGDDAVQIKQSRFTGQTQHILCGKEKPIKTITIQSCDITAPEIIDDGLVDMTSSRDGDVNISDCYVNVDDKGGYSNESNGLEISGGKSINIDTTDITNIPDYGIYITDGYEGQTVALSNVRCNETNSTGILCKKPSVGGGTIKIDDCAANNNEFYGMYIYMEDVTITDTEATGNGDAGLYLENIDRRAATLNGNTFTE